MFVVAIALVIFELGLISRTQVVYGPFASSDGMLSIPIESSIRGLSARSDGMDAASRSALKMSVNGVSYKYPHTLHQKIREGMDGGFSHWGDRVYFSLPATISNGPGVEVTLVYPLQLPSAWMTFGLLGVLLSAGIWIVGDKFSWKLAATALSLPTRFLSLLVWILGFATVAYSITILWAFANGWALPTTAPIRLFSFVRALAFSEQRFPEFLLFSVVVCALFRWLAIGLRIDTAAIDNAEARLSWQIGRFGLPILIAICIFSVSAVWAGLYRPGDVQYMSIQGLVPFSDSGDYFADANHVIREGIFVGSGRYRPIAEVMRTIEYALSGFSYAGTLLIQIVLFACVTFYASAAVARRFGVLAGIAFAVMMYAIGREFLPTFLTESIGLLWALAAVPFFIACFGLRSLTQGIAGIFFFAIGMFARMGAMFTLPAMVLWVGAQSYSSVRSRLRMTGLAALALGLIAIYSYGVAKIYTRENASFASNFSYTACGVSVGGNWTSCPKLYGKEIAAAKNRTGFLYARALANLRADPRPALKLLANNAQAFITQLPAILTEGYVSLDGASFSTVWLVLSAFGFAWLILHREMSFLEFSFWLLIGLSTVASAAVIFQDDGRRVMIVSYPLAALFFSMYLCPRPSKQPVMNLSVVSRPVLVMAGATIVLIAVAATPFVMRVSASPYFPEPRVSDNLVVFGGRRITGTLVVADDKPLPKEIASIHISDFVNIIHHTAVEAEQGLVTPGPPPLPFAFVAAPEANLLSYGRNDLFIAPAEVLSKPNVPFWRFDISPFRVFQGRTPRWYLVTKAEAVSSP